MNCYIHTQAHNNDEPVHQQGAMLSFRVSELITRYLEQFVSPI